MEDRERERGICKLYLDEQLVFCDPLDRFDEVGVDGEGLSQLHLHALRERKGREGLRRVLQSHPGLLCHCTLKNA